MVQRAVVDRSEPFAATSWKRRRASRFWQRGSDGRHHLRQALERNGPVQRCDKPDKLDLSATHDRSDELIHLAVRLILDDDGIELGFACSTPRCGGIAVHYDVDADRLTCDDCRKRDEKSKVRSIMRAWRALLNTLR